VSRTFISHVRVALSICCLGDWSTTAGGGGGGGGGSNSVMSKKIISAPPVSETMVIQPQPVGLLTALLPNQNCPVLTKKQFVS
jgi:hypothetical protein